MSVQDGIIRNLQDSVPARGRSWWWRSGDTMSAAKPVRRASTKSRWVARRAMSDADMVFKWLLSSTSRARQLESAGWPARVSRLRRNWARAWRAARRQRPWLTQAIQPAISPRKMAMNTTIHNGTLTARMGSPGEIGSNATVTEWRLATAKTISTRASRPRIRAVKRFICRSHSSSMAGRFSRISRLPRSACRAVPCRS